MLSPSIKPGRSRLRAVVSLVGGALVWELTTRSGLVPALLIPPPSIVVRHLGSLLCQTGFYRDLWATLAVVLSGFLLGTAVGFAAGIACGRLAAVNDALDPWISATQPLPKVVMLAPLILLFGAGPAVGAVCVAVTVFYSVFVTTRAGVGRLEPSLLDAARNLGAGRADILREVVLPSISPYLFAGMRLGLLGALSVAVVVEMLLPSHGLGSRLWLAGSALEMADFYAYVLAVAALGMSLIWMLGGAQRMLLPWAVAGNHGR